MSADTMQNYNNMITLGYAQKLPVPEHPVSLLYNICAFLQQ